MSKSFANLYSRIVAGCATLLLGITAIISGLVLYVNASSVEDPIVNDGPRYGALVRLKDDFDGEQSDNESSGEKPAEISFKDRPKGYTDRQMMYYTVVHIGDGSGTDHGSGTLGRVTIDLLPGTNPGAFELSRVCGTLQDPNHVHSDIPPFDPLDPNVTVNQVLSFLGKTRDDFKLAGQGNSITLPELKAKSHVCVFRIEVVSDLNYGTHTADMYIHSEYGEEFSNSHTMLRFTVTEPQISVIPTKINFGKVPVGYPMQTAEKVTITNTGTTETGALNVVLNNYSHFDIDTSTMVYNLINKGNSTFFKLCPKSDLPAGDYSVTATIGSAGNYFTPIQVLATFTVEGQASITLEPPPPFPDMHVGYSFDSIPIHTAKIKSDGTSATGDLLIQLTGTNGTSNASFALSKTTTASIPVGSEETFTIRPQYGLGVGTYTAKVTVSSTNAPHVASREFNVSFTVKVAPNYGIALNPPSLTFTAAEGYTTRPAAQTVTITNTGNQETGYLLIVPGENDSNFSVSEYGFDSIATQGGTRSFTVQPIAGLGVGTYTTTLLVKSLNSEVASQTLNITFTVSNYAISLNRNNIFNFKPVNIRKLNKSAEANTPPAVTVIVTNVGSQPTGILKVTLLGEDADNFTLSTNTLSSIQNKNGTAQFTIRPKTNLQSRTTAYFVNVVVSPADNNPAPIESKRFAASYVVYYCCDCGHEPAAANDTTFTWMLGLAAIIMAAILAVLIFNVTPRLQPVTAAFKPVNQGVASQTSLGQMQEFSTQPPAPTRQLDEGQIAPRPQVRDLGGQKPPAPVPVSPTYQAPSRPSPMSSTAQTPSVKSPVQYPAPSHSQKPPVSSTFQAPQQPSSQQPPSFRQ